MDSTQCKAPGCEREARAGWCKPHFGGASRRGLLSQDDWDARFWTWVEVGDCWTWIGPTSEAGYGSYAGKGLTATLTHRHVYQRLVGPIPAGMHIDHLCRNRRCCNPDHLEVVTPRTNVLRGMLPSSIAYRSGVCARGHVLPAPRGHRQRRDCKVCARQQWAENADRYAERRRSLTQPAREARAQERLRQDAERSAIGTSHTTACRHGHAYTSENTYWSKCGTKICRTCKRQKDAEYREARRAQGTAALRVDLVRAALESTRSGEPR